MAEQLKESRGKHIIEVENMKIFKDNNIVNKYIKDMQKAIVKGNVLNISPEEVLCKQFEDMLNTTLNKGRIISDIVLGRKVQYNRTDNKERVWTKVELGWLKRFVMKQLDYDKDHGVSFYIDLEINEREVRKFRLEIAIVYNNLKELKGGRVKVFIDLNKLDKITDEDIGYSIKTANEHILDRVDDDKFNKDYYLPFVVDGIDILIDNTLKVKMGKKS